MKYIWVIYLLRRLKNGDGKESNFGDFQEGNQLDFSDTVAFYTLTTVVVSSKTGILNQNNMLHTVLSIRALYKLKPQ